MSPNGGYAVQLCPTQIDLQLTSACLRDVIRNLKMFKGSIRMTKLYSDLARIYHEMYQSIFDYEKEFLF